MDQNIVMPNTLTGAKNALAAAKARSEEIQRSLTELSRAMDKGRAFIAEHAGVEQRVATLRSERRTMMADSLVGKADSTAIAKSDRDVKIAEARLRELAPIAEDGKAAIAELEARYGAAAAPLKAISAEISVLQARQLEQAAEILLKEYGEKVCSAYDVYLELCALIRARNAHAKAAGLSPVAPDVPSHFEFPGIEMGTWHLENQIGATAAQFEQARDRAEKKLAEMGIS